jgi:hypothetical protein
MITTILTFIAGGITGVLVTLNNTRKLRNAVNTLETEAQELREKVETQVRTVKKKVTKKR